MNTIITTITQYGILMNSKGFIFAILGFLGVLFGILVISASNPVHSIIYLILLFVSISCYLITSGLSFIGLTYLIIYVGAIIILFLFVIMMLNIKFLELNTIGKDYTKSIPLGFFIGVIYFVILQLYGTNFIWNNISLTTQINLFYSIYSTQWLELFHSWFIIETLGYNMYVVYPIIIFLIGFLLLLAMVGPIVICYSNKNEMNFEENSVQKILENKNIYNIEEDFESQILENKNIYNIEYNTIQNKNSVLNLKFWSILFLLFSLLITFLLKEKIITFFDYIINNSTFAIVSYSIIEIFILIIPLLLSVAYLTLFERKMMASTQRRNGPNTVGYFGLGQPLADGLKLFVKETVYLPHSEKILFLLAPIFGLSFSFIIWAVIPFGEGLSLVDLNLGILFIFAISSLSVYAIIFTGWSANSKYAFYGAIRSTASMISYELSLSMIILIIIIYTGTLNLSGIIENQKTIWNFVPLFPLSILFLITALAETNRPPFDFAEAESELVSGFNTEHSAFPFALLFISEYANIIFMSTFTILLFFGGHLIPNILLNSYEFCFLFFGISQNNIPFFSSESLFLGLKVSIILYLFIAIRASYPRLKYLNLITLNWVSILPLLLGLFSLIISIICFFNNI